ncbi:MAG: DUF5060 domain-containing protein [Bacteroidetes bacterium]|nr:DUF5060 domain-containing protein [Bacteroidota bacterium]MDA1121474.1 DUF5060 domain-containing protein [Bacteroidota bacterium]
MTYRYTILIFLSVLLCSCQNNIENDNPQVGIKGQLKKWQKVELSIGGPDVAEYDQINPFLDYRLIVTFQNGETIYPVPGFFAADGNASETSADKGNVWKIRFRPDKVGVWNYTISFRKGKNIAISDDSGEAINGDGLAGQFEVTDANDDVSNLGRVQVDGRYLKREDPNTYFLKGGADSPENFLAYVDFDQTYRFGSKAINREGEANPREDIHKYEPHIQDWNENDPTWKDGKGKGIIGGLNYLASKGVNSQYMLTLNIQGDGKDVWPYSDHNERYRFDCSKLDQWEIVFDHMDKLGMMMHFVLQETENECLLDGGHTGVQRMLYLRELVARFGHHPAVTWNLGEENGPANFSPVGQTNQMRKDMASYLKKVNPYPSVVVVHTHSGNKDQDEILNPLLGFKDIDGPSMQVADVKNINKRVAKFIEESDKTEKQWMVCLDEIGQAWKGVMPDEHDPKHDTVRHHALWGSLMAGGAGVEWYFGYRYPHNDLMCEDFRSRDMWWDQTKIALDFFRNDLPLDQMNAANALVNNDAFCLAKNDEVYVIYIPLGTGNISLDLKNASGIFSVKWYNPRSGGDLQMGSVSQVEGGKTVDIGMPPSETILDWVVLIKKT